MHINTRMAPQILYYDQTLSMLFPTFENLQEEVFTSFNIPVGLGYITSSNNQVKNLQNSDSWSISCLLA